MTPIRFIRTRVFKMTQADFAAVAGVGQASVSRWENGISPSLDEMKAIRDAAIAAGLDWKDEFFFEVTEEVEP